jgi:hypothetical protein
MDAAAWGATADPHPPRTHGELRTLAVELLCTAGSPLVVSSDGGRGRQHSPGLDRANPLADALQLPRTAITGIHVDRLHTRDPDPDEAARENCGCIAVEVPAGVQTAGAAKGRRYCGGDVLTIGVTPSGWEPTPTGDVQVVIPRGVRPGQTFMAPRFIPGTRSEMDVVMVDVPEGLGEGDVVVVEGLGKKIYARVPEGCRGGDVFQAEYHPERQPTPMWRVRFHIQQPFGEPSPAATLVSEQPGARPAVSSPPCLSALPLRLGPSCATCAPLTTTIPWRQKRWRLGLGWAVTMGRCLTPTPSHGWWGTAMTPRTPRTEVTAGSGRRTWWRT